MRGTHWLASRQREPVTGRRFAPNSLRRRMDWLRVKLESRTKCAEMQRWAGGWL